MQTYEGFNLNLETKKRMSMLNSMNEHFSLNSEVLINQLIDEYIQQAKSKEIIDKVLSVVKSRQTRAILENNLVEASNWEYIRMKLEEVI